MRAVFPFGRHSKELQKRPVTGGIAASRNHQAVERSREFTHSLFNSYSAGCLGTRLLSRSVARDPANSVRIARDMGAPSVANPAADRTDIVGVAVAAAVASVIEGVASVERPTAHAKPHKGNLRFTESCADEIACHEPRHPADLVPWRQFGPASVLDRVVLVPAVLVPLLIAGVSLSRIISPTANALFRLQARRCACRVPQGRLRHRRPQNAAGCVASNSQLAINSASFSTT
jgi:hypothetical protein